MKRPPHPALLYGALVLHTFLSAGTYLVGKRALAEIPPLTLGLLRFAIASVCLVGLLYARLPRGQRLPPRDERRRLWGLAFIAVPLNQGFFLVGLSLSTAAHAALLYSLTPLFVLLLAWLALGESLGARGAIGLLFALGGTVFVLLQRGLDLSGGPLLGDLLLVFAVLAWAAYTTGGRKVVARHGPLPTTAWSLVGGTKKAYPALQAKGDSKLLRRLTGAGSRTVEEAALNPADLDEVAKTWESHGFEMRAGETYEPALEFNDFDQFMEFGYRGGWLTPLIETMGLHKAGPLKRWLLNRLAFPIKDQHNIVVALGRKS